MNKIIIFIKTILCLIILILSILILVKIKKYEYFKSFPESEAKYYHSEENTYGIPVCQYKSYTPILTCSYDSRV